MFDCSNLVHHDSLIPPEQMLVSYSPSLENESLYDFLSKMDQIEYRILQHEDRVCRFDPSSLTGGQKFGIGLSTVTIGGMSGFFSGITRALFTGNPIFGTYDAIAGGSASAAAWATWARKTVIEANQTNPLCRDIIAPSRSTQRKAV